MPPTLDAPAAVIRLLDSSGNRVLDSVACDYEDSFCLESLGDLIATHRAVPPPGSRQLIIARVQTWDVRNPEREYYSYYNAFHLNKILFQTQVYLSKRLIHRMHVLNPLTNTDIIGNVLYFAVAALPSRAPPSPSVAAADAGIPQSWTMSSQAVAQLPSENEEKTLPNLLGPLRRISSNVVEEITQKTLPQSPSGTGAKLLLRLPQGANFTGPRSAPADLTSLTIDQGLMSAVPFDNVPDYLPPGASKVPEKPLVLNENTKRNCRPAPPGTLTRFNIPLPKESRPTSPQSAPAAPGTPPSRKRDLSFRNHVERSDFQQWLGMLQPPRSGDKVDSTQKFIDAVLFATDMDYLENASVRARFRANALNQDDCRHFELPEFTGAVPVSPAMSAEPLVLGHESDSALRRYCLPSERELQYMSGPLRAFHRLKFPLLAIIVTLSILFCLIFALSVDNNTSSTMLRTRNATTKSRRLFEL